MNKDQTFKFLLEGISSDIIGWLIEDQGLSISEALALWFNSVTFEKVSEPLTGLYIESSAYNYNILKRELLYGKPY